MPRPVNTLMRRLILASQLRCFEQREAWCWRIAKCSLQSSLVPATWWPRADTLPDQPVLDQQPNARLYSSGRPTSAAAARATQSSDVQAPGADVTVQAGGVASSSEPAPASPWLGSMAPAGGNRNTGRSADPPELPGHQRPLLSAQFPSSADDPFGVQRTWFTSLYKQVGS
jgi:hypothetical protein